MILQTRSGTIALTMLHPDAGLAVAQHVHRLGGLQHHQAHRLDLDAGARDDLQVLAELGQRLAEGLARQAALDHQVERLSALPIERMQWWMRPGPRRTWRDLEAAAFAEQHVAFGTRTLLKLDVHVAARRVVFAEHMHRAEDLHPGVSIGTRICDCCGAAARRGWS
jgi:hypothetical protein